MIVCKFNIKGCAIVAESLPVVAEQNVGTVQAAFEFSADWDGYTKYAVFFRHNNETPLRQVIAPDGTCTIPSAMLAENKGMYIGVYGENADSRMNSAVAAFKPIEGAYRVAVFPGEEPYDPSIWTQLWNAIDAKQDIIGDLTDIRENAQAGADLVPEVGNLQIDLSNLELRVEANENSIDAIEDDIDDINGDIATLDTEKYEKPSTGIPKTDLAYSVQQSLNKADAAYKKPVGGIPKFDLTTQVQESLDKADTALQSVPSTYATKTYVDSHHDATKQDKLTAGENITIEDNVISATGGGGGGAVDSVNGQTGVVVLDAEDVGAYELPEDGIPKVDLSADVQASLDSADTSVGAISAINGKIPAVASSSNKLVSQSEMGDAIESVEAKQLYATASQGSFATKAALTSASVFYNADGTVATPTKNDVAYVLADESHSGKSAKYVIAEMSGTTPVWGFVITFSDTTFSQAQMDAINSGITSAKVTAYDGKYTKPSGGIPKTDLAAAVQTSLGLADTALQSAPVTSVAGKTGAVSLAKGDVGLGNVDNVKQYSASNPPPYPVTSVNGNTGAVTISVPTALSQLSADSTHRTVTDTEKTAWNGKAKVYVQTTAPSSPNVGDIWCNPDEAAATIPTKVSDLTNDSGFLTLGTLPIYDGSVI